jgi:hypothetical protein
MPLPASVPVGTVTGRWYTPSGANAVGSIIFLLTESVEVPDDPDGVVLPLKTVVDVPAGVLNQTLPAGIYQVSMRLSELYKANKVVEVIEGVALNLPDAVGMLLPDPDLYDPVRSVDGHFPDSAGNIDLPDGGGGGVTDHGALTGLADDDHTQYLTDSRGDARYALLAHTHTIANVTGLQTALDGKQPSGSYATSTDLTNGLATKANTAHTHTTSQVTGLDTELDDLDNRVTTLEDAPVQDTAFLAARYGCKAITMDPHNLSPVDPKYIAMTTQRLYQYWVPIATGTTISGVRLPIQDIGVGAGSLWFGVYQDDLTKLGETANVAAAFSAGVGQTWREATLVTPGVVTGSGVWITALSTLDTGPQVVFCNTALASDLPWLLNADSRLTAMRTESVVSLPPTISPVGGLKYLDFVIGVY